MTAQLNEIRSAETTGVEAPLVVRDVVVSHPDGVDESGRPRQLRVLDRASLTARKGEVVGILGPSGSGKSTMLSAIAGLVVPDAGSILVDGAEIVGMPEDQRTRMRGRRIGVVFQQPHLLPSLDVVDQLVVTAHLAGGSLREARTRADELLRLVGLAGLGHRMPHELSGGQRQRVNIARALMPSPAVLLVDESTSALDTQRSRQVAHLLRQVTGELGTATVLVTHDTAITDVCDEVVEMRDGRAVSLSR